MAKSCLGLGWFASAQVQVGEITICGQIIGIEMQYSFKRSSRALLISRAVLGDGQERTRPALRGKQINGFGQRSDRRRILLLVQEKDTQIQMSLGHFRVERDGTLIFGARFIAALQRRVGVAELKMRERHIGLFRNEFLKLSYRGFKVIGVYVVLRFVEKVVERIRYFLRPRLRWLLCGRLRKSCRRVI